MRVSSPRPVQFNPIRREHAIQFVRIEWAIIAISMQRYCAFGRIKIVLILFLNRIRSVHDGLRQTVANIF